MKKLFFLFVLPLFCIQVHSQVLVEAESFDEKGGWVADHQAFEQIKSSYLMAHGMGRPVSDARTVVTFRKTGHYHVYVSTYNWTSPWYDGEGPGAFQVAVGGKVFPAVLGKTGKNWEWQYAGETDIDSHKVEISLKDLTGFNGRVDAIYFSEEKQAPVADYAVMKEVRKKLLGYKDSYKAGKYDLVVVGGGIAGCTTALTAARYGLKVALVDNLPWLGGNAVLGVRIDGAAFKNLYPNLGYAACEVSGIDVSKKNDPDAWRINKGNGTGGAKDEAYLPSLSSPDKITSGTDILDAEARLVEAGDTSRTAKELALLDREHKRQNGAAMREQLLLSAGVRVFHNINVYKVGMKGKLIATVTGSDLTTGKDYIFSGNLFADCTGDGVIGYLSGADWTIGREGKSFANEPSAPDKPDSKMMGSSMAWAAYPRENSGTFPSPAEIPWAFQLDKEYHIDSSQWNWWWETGLEIDNALNAELVRDNFFRAVYGNWAYLKNFEPKYADYRLDYLHHIAMKRESRRLLGDLILTENDVHNHVVYPDASFTSTWTMDVHYAKKNNAERFPGWEWTTSCTNSKKEAYVGSYNIPYRCLYSRNIDNLFAGGRNMSVSHMALGTVRVQLTLGMAGEVIGMAAGICHKHKSPPRSVYTDYLDELKSCMTAGVPGYAGR